MKKYDHMKNMRLLFWKISVVPFCTALAFLLFFFIITDGSVHNYVRVPDAEHAHLEPMPGFPTIYIKGNGTVYFLGNTVEDLDTLPGLVREEFEEQKFEGNKILLKASRYTRFGKVQAVLRVVKRMGIDVAGLVTAGSVSPLNFTIKE